MFLGIDFGTCFSSVAVWESPDGVRYQKVLTGDTGSGIPTVIAKCQKKDDSDKTSPFKCGYECENVFKEEDKIRYIKKQIRRILKEEDKTNPMTLPPDGKTPLYPTRMELVSYLIKYLLKNSIENIKTLNLVSIPNCGKLEGVTIAVPAGLGTTNETPNTHTMRFEYSKALIECVKAALNTDEIKKLLPSQNSVECKVNTIGEPVAAAFAFFKQSNTGDYLKKEKSEGKILVLDLGGGTSDVAVVKYNFANSTPFEVIDEDGDLDLGGNDWTKALFDYINEQHFKGKLVTTGPEYSRIIMNLDLVKSNLSTYDVSTYTHYNNKNISVTREKFEDKTKKLCQRVMKLIDKVVKRNGGISSFKYVVLVGGASQMPQIKDGIVKLYYKDIGLDRIQDMIQSFDPSKAIASGAAFYASDNLKQESKEIVIEVPATYGIDYLNTSENNKKCINNLILKGQKFNQEYIEEESLVFYPRYSDQKEVETDVYESDCKDKTAELDPKVFHYSNKTLTVKVPERFFKVPETFSQKKKRSTKRLMSKKKKHELERQELHELELQELGAKRWSHKYKMRLYRDGRMEFYYCDCDEEGKRTSDWKKITVQEE